MSDRELIKEAQRRRTFAIISHPDAGKTTLTEKLLLYSNAIHLAGSVKARRSSRHAVSDWMKMEQERGISVTSSVLNFEHHGKALNLLDTPGHADFSEDTFRTLAAVDSAVMLMDHSKGVEDRTRKLFEVCRMRQMPVITFMNKLDRAGLDPLELLDDVSKSLNLRVAPLNWPIGMGREFRGVVDLATRDVLVFDAEQHGATAVRARRVPWPEAEAVLGTSLFKRVADDLELVEEAGDAYRHEGFLAGDLSPVFWGSAMNNFGVEVLLDYLAERAAPPTPRFLESGESVAPESPFFSGMVFKIQANMNPKHRDRVAFVRVVSGHFERGMDVQLGRTGETIRLSRPHSFMAQDRSLVDEAWPGDIVGLFDSGKLRVGDTLSTEKGVRFDGIPRFAPEHFGRLRLKDPMRRKALDVGLEQLAHEGVIQLFYDPMGIKTPCLGAVGLLQFEVLRERLKNEYSVQADLEGLPYSEARWVEGPDATLTWLKEGREYTLLLDRNRRPVLFADSEWALNYAVENAPTPIKLHKVEPL
jgi:peptide chain release factor 3